MLCVSVEVGVARPTRATFRRGSAAALTFDPGLDRAGFVMSGGCGRACRDRSHDSASRDVQTMASRSAGARLGLAGGVPLVGEVTRRGGARAIIDRLLDEPRVASSPFTDAPPLDGPCAPSLAAAHPAR